jgi:hypothetical protein
MGKRLQGALLALTLIALLVTPGVALAAKNLGSPGTPANTFTGCDVQFKTTAVTLVAATAGKLPATPLSQRQGLMVYNNDSATVYLGASNVTNSGATTGFILPAGASVPITLGPDIDLYGYSAAGETTNVIVAECA